MPRMIAILGRHVFLPHPTFLSFRTGRWRWPWAMLSIFVAMVLIIAAAFLSLEFLFDPSDLQNWLDGKDEILRPGYLVDYLLIVCLWSSFAIAAFLTIRLVKGDSFSSILCWSGRFPYSDLFKAALALLICHGLFHLLAFLIEPSTFVANVRRSDFLVWIGIGLITIFVQSSSEEVLFRGYLVRTLGAVAPIASLVIGGLIVMFVALHVPNADMQRDLEFGLIYFTINEVIAYVVLLRTKSLAAPMGLHWANNVFLFLGVATVPGDAKSAALFLYYDEVYAANGSYLYDPQVHITAVVMYAVLLTLLFWRRSPLRLPTRDLPRPPTLEPPAPIALGQGDAEKAV